MKDDKKKELVPDFKQIKLEFSLNVEKDGRMRLEASIRLDGKSVEIADYTDAQLFGLYEIVNKVIEPCRNYTVGQCLKRSIVMLDGMDGANTGKA